MIIQPNNYDGLDCPICRGNCLHHGKIVVYGRGEDDVETVVTTIERKKLIRNIVASKGCGNPSSRRDGLTIELWCENCQNTVQLNIFQHKGYTYFDWQKDVKL